jgi:hypothetical protein
MNPYPNLPTILNDLPYHYYYPQADKFLELNLPFKNFSTLPLMPGMEKNSGSILKAFKPTVPHPVIIPFKPSAKIEHICLQNNWKLVAVNSKLNRHLEDKLLFSDLARSNNIPTIPYTIGPLTQSFVDQCLADFGPQLVIQTHFGWAGLSTYIFSSKDTLPVALNTPVKIMPLVDGVTYTNNCCLTKWGSIVGPPALQINGLPTLSSNSFATTGRQWPSFLPPRHLKKIQSLSTNIATFLQKLQFRGFYGVDYLVTPKEVYVLEINPRLTASANFYTQLELKNNYIPTIYWHMAEFLELNLPATTYDFKPYFSHNLQGSEVTPKSISGHTAAKHWFWQPVAKNYPPRYDLKIISAL